MNRRELTRMKARQDKERYGRDVQAALLVYKLQVDPSAAHRIATECFDPSPAKQAKNFQRVWFYLKSGFNPNDIPEWWSAEGHMFGHTWYRAGYKPRQAHWVDREVRNLLHTDDHGAAHEDPDSSVTATMFIKRMIAEGHPAESVVLALRAGPKSAAELLTWLRAAKNSPAHLQGLKFHASLTDIDGPEDEDA